MPVRGGPLFLLETHQKAAALLTFIIIILYNKDEYCETFLNMGGERMVEMDQHVVIIGAGFAGLQAARALGNRPGVRVTLVDRQNYHLLQALLYQVATAALEQETIAHPIRPIVRRWRNVRFHLDEVLGVDLAGREVITRQGRLGYDYLIVAAGAVTGFFGMKDVQQQAYELKDLDDAVRLRSQILSAFECAATERDPLRRAALLTFVVAGGGPTGVELAGALAELVGHVLVKDYPGLSAQDVRIVLVEAADDPLPYLEEPLRRYTRERLEQMGIEVRTGVAVRAAAPGRVMLADGQEIAAETLIWAAGVQAAPLAAAIGTAQGRGGRLIVAPDLSLPGHPEVFVAGDMAYLEQDGVPLPQVAPVAMQQGRHAAEAILTRLAGRSPEPFRYRDSGTMAMIGRGKGVASVAGLRLKGFAAWAAWVILHLYRLIGVKNRLVVLLNWAFNYVLFDRKVRLIVQETDSGALPAIRGNSTGRAGAGEIAAD